MKLILQFENYDLELRERDSVSVQRQTASKLPPVCTLTSDSKDLAFNLAGPGTNSEKHTGYKIL